MNWSELIVSCCGCGTFRQSEPISCGWPPPPGPRAAPVPPSPAALVQVGLRFCRENVLLVAGKEKNKARPAAVYPVDLCGGAQDVFSVFSIRAASRRKVVDWNTRGLDAIFGHCVSATAKAAEV